MELLNQSLWLLDLGSYLGCQGLQLRLVGGRIPLLLLLHAGHLRGVQRALRLVDRVGE